LQRGGPVLYSKHAQDELLKHMNKKTQVATTKSPEAPQVLSAEQVKHSDFVKGLGQDIIRKTGEIGGLYLKLIIGIRTNKIAPKLVSFELGALGFRRSRVSEINRVANASDKLFSEFEARVIGFDKALELARAEKGKPASPTPAATLLLGSGDVDSEDVERAEKEAEAPSTPSKKVPMALKIKAAAKLILANAKTERTWWNEGEGFKLMLVKCNPQDGKIG